MASTTFELSVDKVLSIEDRAHIASVLELIASAHGLQLDTKVVEPKFTYKIKQDHDPENPRTAWDNVGVMFCKHGRYTLGDKDADDPYEEVDGVYLDKQWVTEDTLLYALDMMREILAEDDTDDIQDVVNELDELQFQVHGRSIVRDDIAICLPLYLYDHGGITISHGAFSCKWDSGQVGWHYITKAKLEDEFDGEEAKAMKCLEAELKTYDDYLQGNVWGYVIENEDGDDVDSCWGFYGDELEETGILGHVAAEHVEGLTEAWERRFDR